VIMYLHRQVEHTLLRLLHLFDLNSTASHAYTTYQDTDQDQDHRQRPDRESTNAEWQQRQRRC